MFKSIVFKEWLKIRWFLIILSLIGIIAAGNIFLKVQHNIAFNEATKYWYLILFQNHHYFSSLKFLPLFIGLVIAAAQYIPEIMERRIKLTFHLPINENKILIMMLGFGTISILVSFAIMFFVFVGLSNFFFAKEIVHAVIVSVTPWFLGGFAAYFLAALIILEAIWKYRIAYFITASAFMLLFFENSVAGGYSPINLKMAILTLLISVSLLFSAYRFRKGEM